MIFDISKNYLIGNYDNFDIKRFEAKFYSALRADLDKYGIDRSSYALNGLDAGGGVHCLCFDNPFWVVCISERGERINPAFFSGAWEAANYLIWNLMRGKKMIFLYSLSIRLTGPSCCPVQGVQSLFSSRSTRHFDHEILYI